MWTPTNNKVDALELYIKLRKRNNLCLFLLTNLDKFWVKQADDTSLSSMHCSKNIEVEDDVIWKHLIDDDFRKKTLIKIDSLLKDNDRVLKVAINIDLSDGFCIELKFEAELNNISLYKNITVPFLICMMQLIKKNEILSKLLKESELMQENKLLGLDKLLSENLISSSKNETHDSMCNADLKTINEVFSHPIVQSFCSKYYEINENLHSDHIITSTLDTNESMEEKSKITKNPGHISEVIPLEVKKRKIHDKLNI